MNLKVTQLDLLCRLEQVTVAFGPFSYFYGEIGAGKSSIVRLIDYCLGGELTMTPALQSEFVGASITMDVGGHLLKLDRDRGANQVVASWATTEGEYQVVVPARDPAGVVLPETEVEVVSDLLFHLAGLRPPRVRRGITKPDSGLQRLSFRDLFWYCYLDQEEIDSNFFNLDADADQWRRLKSRNVLRYILGIHAERVAELEQELEDVRRSKIDAEASGKALRQTLQEAGIGSRAEIANRLTGLETRLQELTALIAEGRERARTHASHAADDLRRRARELSSELESVDIAKREIMETLVLDRRHLNEITALATKIRRIGGARAVLNGVEFEKCPRCAQTLPERPPATCTVCGQADPDLDASPDEIEQTRADVASRSAELREVIERQAAQLQALRRRGEELADSKQEVDRRLTDALITYDSAYLAGTLELERERAAVIEEHRFLDRLVRLPTKVEELSELASALAVKESALRAEIQALREASEKDQQNLSMLKELFLNCLLRSKLSGFAESDEVRFEAPAFYPEVLSADLGDMTITSFATEGSGGKKTLFKCCFALAVHRLARQIGAVLPTLLIIDSPMKNISERENRTQFEGFHQLMYELAESELAETQFILVDKEFCPPPATFGGEVVSRHMRVDDDIEPPLIPYFRDRRGRNLAATEEPG